MQDSDLKITLWLNSAGFADIPIRKVLPDWDTERDVTISSSWEPCFNGPDSWALTIAFLAGGIASGFLGELGKDVYTWVKRQLQPVLLDKPNHSPMVIFEHEGLSYIIDPAQLGTDLAHSIKLLITRFDRIAESAKVTLDKSEGDTIRLQVETVNFEVTVRKI